jgi:hypothetical protein
MPNAGKLSHPMCLLLKLLQFKAAVNIIWYYSGNTLSVSEFEVHIIAVYLSVHLGINVTCSGSCAFFLVWCLSPHSRWHISFLKCRCCNPCRPLSTPKWTVQHGSLTNLENDNAQSVMLKIHSHLSEDLFLA